MAWLKLYGHSQLDCSWYICAHAQKPSGMSSSCQRRFCQPIATADRASRWLGLGSAAAKKGTRGYFNSKTKHDGESNRGTAGLRDGLLRVGGRVGRGGKGEQLGAEQLLSLLDESEHLWRDGRRTW
jgi:hypothetical protein